MHPSPTRSWLRCVAAAALGGVLLTTPLHGAPAPAPQGAPAQKGQAAAPVPVNRDARIMADLDTRLRDYAALHEKLESTLQPLARNSTPAAIDAHQRDLARLISRARSRARPGDILTSETRALFRRRIAGILATPAGPAVRAAILDEDPGRINVLVNGRYPDAVPLSTVPTELLEALPRLPEQLEYHFISHQLILFDVHARIVVDLIDNALPR